jgi:hypothetical protein
LHELQAIFLEHLVYVKQEKKVRDTFKDLPEKRAAVEKTRDKKVRAEIGVQNTREIEYMFHNTEYAH